MSARTAIGQKLEIAIRQELTRMDNEWFYKWHFIGREGPVEIESFQGKPIRYGGIAYVGSPVEVYWSTISRYASLKVSEFFEFVEHALSEHPKNVREKSIYEEEELISRFSASIRTKAIEKDRILRGNGICFPTPHDKGQWNSSSISLIRRRSASLVESYCGLTTETEDYYIMERMMKEDLSFVKLDGAGRKDGIKGLVSGGKIFTFDVSLPIQSGDRFLRALPSGLVEEFIIEDPGYQAGFAGAINPHFQAKVRRSDAAPASANQIINNIQGENARINIDSTDNSYNSVVSVYDKEIFSHMRESLAAADCSDDIKISINEAIDGMEKSIGKNDFKEKYQKFISIAADHMSVFGPFLAALSKLL